MLLHIDGFDQFQKQTGATLLASLQSAGYVTSQGLAVGPGRHDNSYALELQVSAGAAGASWSRRTNPLKATLYDAGFDSQGRWITVGVGGAMGTSQDTITWAPLTSGTPNTLRSITYADGLWVTVGEKGTILTSPDGVTWTARICPLPNATLRSVHRAQGRYVAVGGNGTAGAIVTSEDGVTWAAITENSGNKPLSRVRYGGAGWLAVGEGSQCLFSTDGINWVNKPVTVSANITGCAHDGSAWVVTVGGAVYRTADLGVTWTKHFEEVVRSRSLTDIGYTDGRWIVSTDYGGVATSDDSGMTWTTRSLPGSGSQEINSLKVLTGATAIWMVVGRAFSEGTASAASYIYVSAAPPTTVKRTFTSNAAKVVLGFAHRANARGRILSIDGLLNMDWPAGIEILGVTGEAVPIRNAWYYYEIEIDRAAAQATLYINNTRDVTVPLPEAVAEMVDFTVTWQSENGAISRIDDMYFLDSDTGTGGPVVEGEAAPVASRMISRLRPIRIPVRLPTADAHVEWDSSSQGDHWTHVGLLPPSTSSFIRSSTSGAKDMFTSSTPLPEGAGTGSMPIIAVGVIALAQKSDLDHRQLGLVIGSGDKTKEVIDTTLSMTPEYSLGVFESAADGSMWTVESIESTPFGVSVRP